jgi:hypothetical protein
MSHVSFRRGQEVCVYKSRDESVARETLAEVQNLVNDEFLQNGIQVPRIDPEGFWLKDQGGVELPLRDMSDGYRAALALLVDIARHMIAVYGPTGLTATNDKGRVCINRSGVVLIDEVDAHLHPQWQRQIGFWLKDHFPHVQFLVATHSAFICQATDRQGLFNLPAPGSGVAPFQISDEDVSKIVTGQPNTILLSPAFSLRHTRSPRVVGDQERYSKLLAKASQCPLTPQEKSELENLERELHPLLQLLDSTDAEG